MTTPDPLDGLLLPYSVTLTPIANTYGFAADGPVDLPTGVVLVRLTWDGPEKLRYRLDRTVNGETRIGKWNYVIDLAPGGTPRSSVPIEISVKGPTRFMCQLDRSISQETVDAGYMAGMSVIPLGGPIT